VVLLNQQWVDPRASSSLTWHMQATRRRARQAWPSLRRVDPRPLSGHCGMIRGLVGAWRPRRDGRRLRQNHIAAHGRSRDVTSEAARLRKARYRRSAKGKAAAKAAASRYKRSAKGKAANARYRRSEKGKAVAMRYRHSSAGKAANAKARARGKERSADAPRP
jgi:hypothetical protein